MSAAPRLRAFGVAVADVAAADGVVAAGVAVRDPVRTGAAAACCC